MPSSFYKREFLDKQPCGWTYTDPNDNKIENFAFEEVDLFYWYDFAMAYRSLWIYTGIVYILGIFGLKRFMRDRPAYDLKMPLFWWNTASGVYSIIGLCRVLPGFLYTLSLTNGFYISICSKTNGDVPGGYWIMLFVLSKFWELGDTVFIVLRKRNLVFLQWYHHLITMTTVWIVGMWIWTTVWNGSVVVKWPLTVETLKIFI